jgi:type I restriction enzyme M protein
MAKGGVKSEVKAACDILRTDDGTSSVNDYMEQLSWMMFLKIFE